MTEDSVASRVRHQYQEVDSPGVAFLVAAPELKEDFRAGVPVAFLVADQEEEAVVVEAFLVAADMEDTANENQSLLKTSSLIAVLSQI
jgi:hypothetical protein